MGLNEDREKAEIKVEPATRGLDSPRSSDQLNNKKRLIEFEGI